MKRGCRKPTKKVEAIPEVKSAEKLSTNAAAEAEVSKPWFDEDTELADRESYDLDYANVLRALGNEVPWLSKHYTRQPRSRSMHAARSTRK